MTLRGHYKDSFGFSFGNVIAKSDIPHLGSPRGIALNEDVGIMYVCEMFGQCVHVFTMDGTHVTCFGKNFLDKPWNVLIYKDSLLLTDVGRQSVIMYRGCTHEEVNNYTDVLIQSYSSWRAKMRYVRLGYHIPKRKSKTIFVMTS